MNITVPICCNIKSMVSRTKGLAPSYARHEEVHNYSSQEICKAIGNSSIRKCCCEDKAERRSRDEDLQEQRTQTFFLWAHSFTTWLYMAILLRKHLHRISLLYLFMMNVLGHQFNEASIHFLFKFKVVFITFYHYTKFLFLFCAHRHSPAMELSQAWTS